MVTVKPSTQSVEVTQTAKFTTTVTGIGPFHYQWQRENDNITGETNSTLIINNVSHNDQANYSCCVSNNYGDYAISNQVSLQVTSMYKVLLLLNC